MFVPSNAIAFNAVGGTPLPNWWNESGAHVAGGAEAQVLAMQSPTLMGARQSFAYGTHVLHGPE
jgi:hypothetical protein